MNFFVCLFVCLFIFNKKKKNNIFNFCIRPHRGAGTQGAWSVRLPLAADVVAVAAGNGNLQLTGKLLLNENL